MSAQVARNALILVAGLAVATGPAWGDGPAVGSQFQVNSYTTDAQYEAAVGGAANGDFVVVWRSEGSYGSDDESYSVQGQRYDADGTPLGGQFQVNSYTTDGQYSPAVGVEANGDFVVVWTSWGSYGSDDSSYSIQSQRYAAAGPLVGGQFQVNSYTTSSQRYPALGVAANGDFVVVWESDGSSGSDTSDDSVQGQRFDPSIFADGFESGDTSAWSHTVP